jgi:hypothetical protein
MNIATDQDIAVLTRYNKESSDYLRDMLFGDKLEKRVKWFKLFESNPVFEPRYDNDLD